MVRVYLLDDHEVVRRGLRELLEVESDLVVVGESASALEATRRIPALRPDVMVLDARLPDGSGIDVCRHVRSVDPTIGGLILTSYDDDDALRAAVLAGAAGYLLKDVRGVDLVDVDPAGGRRGEPARRGRRRTPSRRGGGATRRTRDWRRSPPRSAGSSTTSPKGSRTDRSASRCHWPRRR